MEMSTCVLIHSFVTGHAPLPLIASVLSFVGNKLRIKPPLPSSLMVVDTTDSMTVEKDIAMDPLVHEAYPTFPNARPLQLFEL